MSNSRPNIVTFNKGESILIHGDSAEHIYLIVSGRISVWRHGLLLTSLSSQSLIGMEGMYNKEGTYAYTAKAETLCRLARYPIDQFMEAIYRTPRLTELSFTSLARQLDLCWEKVTTPPVQEEVFFSGDIKSYEPGELIIKEGEDTDDIYRIISTEMGLEVTKGNHVLATLVEAGEVFGEMAAVLQEERTASVRSIGKSVLEVYPASHLMDVLSDYSDLSLRIIKSLSRRLAETSRSLTELKKGPDQ